MLVLDGRWDGNYGIGRVGREVRARLEGECTTFTSPYSPLGGRGLWELWRELRSTGKTDWFWSPGFTGTFPTTTPQLLTVWDLVHLQHDGYSRRHSSYYQLVVKPAILRSGAVLTGTTAGEADIREWLGPAGRHVTIRSIGCGVSAAFRPRAVSREPNRALVVSSVLPHKNVRVVLEALSLLPEVRVTWVVGDVPAATRMVTEAAVSSQVEILTDVDDDALALLYGKSACLVFPSVSEGFGLPPIEAMSCGTPVVYFHGAGAVRETCGSYEQNTAVSSHSDAAEWAGAIEAAVRQPRRVDFDGTPYSWKSVSQRLAHSLVEITQQDVRCRG